MCACSAQRNNTFNRNSIDSADFCANFMNMGWFVCQLYRYLHTNIDLCSPLAKLNSNYSRSLRLWDVTIIFCKSMLCKRIVWSIVEMLFVKTNICQHHQHTDQHADQEGKTPHMHDCIANDAMRCVAIAMLTGPQKTPHKCCLWLRTMSCKLSWTRARCRPSSCESIIFESAPVSGCVFSFFVDVPRRQWCLNIAFPFSLNGYWILK